MDQIKLNLKKRKPIKWKKLIRYWNEGRIIKYRKYK